MPPEDEVTGPGDGGQPGYIGARITLAEGFDDLGSGRLVAGFARHFMVVVDAWKESGFAAVAKSYLQWLPSEAGVRRDIDANGDLMVRRMGDVERRPLLPRLAEAAWLDPQTRGPRL